MIAANEQQLIDITRFEEQHQQTNICPESIIDLDLLNDDIGETHIIEDLLSYYFKAA